MMTLAYALDSRQPVASSAAARARIGLFMGISKNQVAIYAAAGTPAAAARFAGDY
jgi:hypothetical protein